MIKNSIGELKVYPIKEDGMFVFFNDFITINGKVSKDDTIKVFVPKYDLQDGIYKLDVSQPAKATLIVRGKEVKEDTISGYSTLEKLYDHVSAIYKEKFYFGDGDN